MGSFRLFRKQTGRMVVTLGLLTATIVPSFMPALASAAIVSQRSIALSSSSKGADNVSYQINFTPVADAGAFAVWFCNSPAFGEPCVAPGGFDLGTPTTTSTEFTVVSAPTTNKLVVSDSTNTLVAGTPVSVDVAGITNPAAAGSFYARIVTFDTAAHATSEAEDGTDAVDNGSVAMSITDSIAVQGRVLETMVFCVSGGAALDGSNPIGAGCSGTLVAPTLQLGEDIGDTVALSSNNVSSGSIYTQLSTNAVGGAVVSLKSSTDCGGMKRVGASLCDIAPAQQTDIAAGQAKFGLTVAADTTTDTAQSASGTLEVKPGSGYGATYALNYSSDDTSGVTSVYGDPILDTGTDPLKMQPMNRNMKLTFGASVAPNTPAGTYSTSLSLVATGKF